MNDQAQAKSSRIVMGGQQARADRVAHSLKRLGFRLSKVGRSFNVTDNTGALAINSKPAMALAEIENWIGVGSKRSK